MPTVTVNGMSCEHCRKAVTEAVLGVPGVADAVVDLQKKEARWTDADPAHPADAQAVKNAVNNIGFEAI